MAILKKITSLKYKVGGSLIGLSYIAQLFAWFPKVDPSLDMTNGQNTLTVTGNILKKGAMILLFIVSIGMFIKFITTVSHGIEITKKKEEGMMTDFAIYMVMAIVYLTVSLGAGYLGYTVITKFSV